jgi:general secretion pathway protein K
MLPLSRDKEKGMALLLVLSLVSLLTIITLQFGLEMRQQYVVSAGLGDQIKLSEMGISGITISKGLLLQDLAENKFDSLYDSWALIGEEKLPTFFTYGELKISITDENGKFPLNAMVLVKKELGKKPVNDEEFNKLRQQEHDVRNVLWRLMRAEPFLVEDGNAREIIDSIIDWIDSGDGDGEEEYGAEDSHYMQLNPPYHCKNGPIESVEELLLIQGVTAELLYGTQDKPGLAPLLTPWGDEGKINLNTAAQPILQAMAEGIDKDTSESMIEYREDEVHKDQLANHTWYKDVPSFPQDITISEELATVQSRVFTINAEASIGTLKKTVTTTIKRNEQNIAIVRWHTE